FIHIVSYLHCASICYKSNNTISYSIYANFNNIRTFCLDIRSTNKKFLKRMFSDRGHQITVFLLLLCCTISRLPTAFAI
ncbi:hypothetical protein WUBG_18117, partial [Wuchereria bancrofti]